MHRMTDRIREEKRRSRREKRGKRERRERREQRERRGERREKRESREERRKRREKDHRIEGLSLCVRDIFFLENSFVWLSCSDNAHSIVGLGLVSSLRCTAQ